MNDPTQKVKKRASKTPVASFGPELMQVLLMAARGEDVKIDFPAGNGMRTARHMRARIYALRHAMREEHHPDAGLVMRAKVTIPDERGSRGSEKATILITRQDAEFAGVLKAKGVEAPATPTAEGGGDILDEIASTTTKKGG